MTQLEVRTLLSDETRPLVGDALVRCNSLRDDITSHALSHAVCLRALYLDYDYRRTSCLVVDLQTALPLLRATPARAPVNSLQSLVAGWDCSVLLARLHHRSALLPVLKSPLKRRIVIISSEWLTAETMALALVQALHQSPDCLVLPASLPHHIARALSALPSDVAALLWRVVRAPHDWTVDRIADAYGITRRSLERKCLKWGLPAPAELLRTARDANEVKGAGAMSDPVNGIETLRGKRL